MFAMLVYRAVILSELTEHDFYFLSSLCREVGKVELMSQTHKQLIFDSPGYPSSLQD